MPQSHTVQPGNTLSGIAERYLGRASKWPQIQAANPKLFPEGETTIFPGQVLVIPDFEFTLDDLRALEKEITLMEAYGGNQFRLPLRTVKALCALVSFPETGPPAGDAAEPSLSDHP